MVKSLFHYCSLGETLEARRTVTSRPTTVCQGRCKGRCKRHGERNISKTASDKIAPLWLEGDVSLEKEKDFVLPNDGGGECLNHVEVKARPT